MAVLAKNVEMKLKRGQVENAGILPLCGISFANDGMTPSQLNDPRVSQH